MHVRSVTIDPAVSQRLGDLLADKEAVIRALDGLRRGLREQAAGYQADRDEGDPDFLFNVPVPVPLRGRLRVVRFSVNDTTSPDHFFVEAVSMSD